MSILTLSFAAFIAGILGSIHCMSMCGGIACSAGYFDGKNNVATQEKPVEFVTQAATFAFINNLKFNFGRILSYTLLGALFATVGHHIINLSDSRTILSVFRYFSAFLIALIGFKYLFDFKLIDQVEKAGYKLWTWLKAKLNINKYLSASSLIPLGMVWGLLPCGLIYTMLLSASSAGSVWGGSLIMFAFGLGTLPAMLSISSISKTLKESANSQWIKTVFGVALLMLALLLVFLEVTTPIDDMCYA